MPPVNSHAHVRIPGPYRFGERSTPAPIIRAYSPRLIYGGRFKGNPVMIGMGNKQNVQKPISTHPLQERQLLWAVRISDAPLDTSAASPILQKHLTAAEREKVCRFIRVPDQQRALLSVLLQRAAVKHCFPSLSTADYDLPRTREVCVTNHL